MRADPTPWVRPVFETRAVGIQRRFMRRAGQFHDVQDGPPGPFFAYLRSTLAGDA